MTGEPTRELPPVSRTGDREDLGPVEMPSEIEGYQIIGFLGRGGMGAVWRARQLSTKRKVALKVLTSPAFRSKTATARFEREVELAAKLEHPHIARVYDSSTRRVPFYYAMELIDGVPLDSYVKHNTLAQRQVVELMRTVCRAVQHAHQRGVIHRDLKPSNILVTDDGQPHVVDFGLAKTLHDDGLREEISRDGELAGTPAYMSPEQAAGHPDRVDMRTDVYSLGVILYRLLTGRLPRDMSGLSHDVVRRIAENELVRPRHRTRKIDRELEAILLKALARDPERRYSMAGGLADDLDNYLKGEPLAARRPAIGYFLFMRLRKYRAAVAVALALLALLAGMAVISYVRVARARANAEEKAELLRRALYTARIGLARAEYRVANIARVRRLLGLCPADLRGWEWHHLQHVLDQSQHTIRCDGEPVAMALSPDGRRIASALYGQLVLWDARTCQPERHCPLGAGTVASIAFDPHGKLLATGGIDATIAIWHADTGQQQATIPRAHRGAVRALAFSPDGQRIASAGADGLVKVWHVHTSKQVLGLAGHTDFVWSVDYSPDGRTIVSGSWDRTLKTWDAATGEMLHTFGGHTHAVYAAAFSPDGQRIVSADGGGLLKIWQASTGRTSATLYGHSDTVRSAAFSPDGQTIVSGGADRTVRLWDAPSGRQKRLLRGHAADVLAVAFAPDGSHVISASGDKTLKMWDLEATCDALCLTGHKGAVHSLAVHPRGRYILSGGADRSLRLWDLTTAEAVVMAGHGGAVRCVAFSPDGQRIVSASEDRTVRLWHTQDQRELRCLTGHKGPVFAAAFSSDGRWIASGGRDMSLRIWDAARDVPPRACEGHKDELRCVAFSPDGTRIASGSRDSTLRLWDAAAATPLTRLAGHSDGITSVAFGPRGRLVASGSEDTTIRLWDLQTGGLPLVLRGHAGPVRSVTFSPDGARIASGSDDMAVKIWDPTVCSELLTLRGHEAGVTAVAFTHDGRRLVSAARDGAIRVWRAGRWDDDPRQAAAVMSIDAPREQ